MSAPATILEPSNVQRAIVLVSSFRMAHYTAPPEEEFTKAIALGCKQKKRSKQSAHDSLYCHNCKNKAQSHTDLTCCQAVKWVKNAQFTTNENEERLKENPTLYFLRPNEYKDVTLAPLSVHNTVKTFVNSYRKPCSKRYCNKCIKRYYNNEAFDPMVGCYSCSQKCLCIHCKRQRFRVRSDLSDQNQAKLVVSKRRKLGSSA